jgi:hypothetical protein
MVPFSVYLSEYSWDWMLNTYVTLLCNIICTVKTYSDVRLESDSSATLHHTIFVFLYSLWDLNFSWRCLWWILSFVSQTCSYQRFGNSCEIMIVAGIRNTPPPPKNAANIVINV